MLSLIHIFILPFAPAEAYADEDDPFKVLVLSRTMFGVVVVDVANKNTPITGAQVTLISVSYTHLDVYKRQPMHFPHRIHSA